ncbi:hypothetical protein GE061_015538 [Apolygus lucorum]|uniref:Uncharacterized protein n=1 Tax=Apolygus lucorum TaxID=248454 RepID=A0A6A4JNX1_APOLU|nr:hypothetical protein GE061_015538 [Apolygus lucorum]
MSHPRYTAGCDSCEAELKRREADRRAKNRIRQMLSRVQGRYNRMKKTGTFGPRDPQERIPRHIVKLADAYLDEIRHRPELMRRYGPLAGVTLSSESESEGDEQTRTASVRLQTATGATHGVSPLPSTSRG